VGERGGGGVHAPNGSPTAAAAAATVLFSMVFDNAPPFARPFGVRDQAGRPARSVRPTLPRKFFLRLIFCSPLLV